MAKKLMKGSEAIGEAAVQAGYKLFFGYPITPQNEIPEYMSHRLQQIGGTFVQAESELGACNMVFGAAATGEMVFTTSSSPGISLMSEGISYIAGAQLPAVFVNIVRGGPVWAASSRPSRTTSRPPRAAATGTTGCSPWPRPRSRRRWT